MTGQRGAALERVEAALEAHGCRRGGPSMWQCPVPQHDDHDPSLSVKHGNEGALVKCRSRECPLEDILGALSLTKGDLFDVPQERDPSERCRHKYERVTVYEYVRAGLSAVAQRVERKRCSRCGDKTFLPWRPTAAGGWECKAPAVGDRVPYHLDEVQKARNDGIEILLNEGEKACDRARAAGYVATTFPGGAPAKLLPQYAELLRGARIAIVADRDDAGQKCAEARREFLRKVAQVRVVLPAVTSPKADLYDHLEAGLGFAELVPLENEELPAYEAEQDPMAGLRAAAALDPDKRTEAAVAALRAMGADGMDAGTAAIARAYVKREHLLAVISDFDRIIRQAARAEDDGDGGDKCPTQSEILAGHAQERFTLHRDGDDQPYALPREGAPIARYLRGGRSLRAELAGTYLRERGRPASSSALADALGAIEGLALTAEIHETYIRAARADGAVYLDLGRDDGAAVKIDATGWAVMHEPPVIWHRTGHTGPLPDPERGGSLTDLWHLARAPEPLQPLAAAWICCALLGLVTPVLDISGEHGSGKTSAARVIGNLVDTVKPGGPPGNAVDLVVAAASRMIVLVDNLENLPPWLAATLCRLVTGEELSRRALYTDSDDVVLSLRRPIITTSIDVGAVPPDYADRLVRMAFPVLGEDASLSEEQWADAWQQARPRAMGAVLDLAARVLAVLPRIRLERTPRMGDYSRVLAAVDQVLGTSGLDTYRAQRGKAEADSIESDPAGSALLAWFGDRSRSWEGSMTDLLEALTPAKQPSDWPKTQRALQAKLAKLAKLAKPLRRAGINLSSTGEKQAGTRRTLWRIERVPAQPFNPSDPSRTGTEQAEHPEGSGEGSQPPDGNPSPILRGDTLPDLRKEETKDVKGCAGTLLPEPREENCTICGLPLDPTLIEAGYTTHGEDEPA